MTDETRTIIIATGGRRFRPSLAWESALARHLRELDAAALFHGDADGADRWAGDIARRLKIPVHVIPALWRVEDKRAGPVRNARMLRWAMLLGEELGLEVVVLAMPGNRGTADMKRRARKAGVRVNEVAP